MMLFNLILHLLQTYDANLSAQITEPENQRNSLHPLLTYDARQSLLLLNCKPKIL